MIGAVIATTRPWADVAVATKPDDVEWRRGAAILLFSG